MTRNILRILTIVTAVCASPSLLETSNAEEAKTPNITTNGVGDAPKPVDWSYLAPENGRPFNDPFARLSSDQLANLSYVVRVRRMIAEDKIDANGEDAKAAVRLSRKLNGDGIDIGWLMVQRQRVQQLRGLQIASVSQSIAQSLVDTQVTVTGYVTPITIDNGQVTEFFLVPTVAACSHEAAPPPLQVVYVSTDEGFAAPDKATPVRVTGIIKAGSETRTKMSASGKTTVRSAYTMLSPAVETYAPPLR